MYLLNPSRKYCITLSILAMLCSGCAKKRQKIVLPPLKKAHFEQKKDTITLKVRELNEQELGEITPEGLGSYKIGRIPVTKKQDAIESSSYVQVLYATLINESNQAITFSRKSISLPVLPPHNAYGFSNGNMILNFFVGACGVLVTGAGIALLITTTPGYHLYTCGSSIVALGGSDLNMLANSIFTALGIEMALIGFTMGAQEATRKNHLNNFTHDTMLTDTYRTLLPEETVSWLMVINSDKYDRTFTVSCNTDRDRFIDFDVHIPSTEPF